MDGHACVVLFDAGAIVIGDDRCHAHPPAHGLIENHVQPAAMDADLGKPVAAEFAARLLVDELAEAVEEAAFAVLDTGGEQFLVEAQRGKLAHGVRQQRDADAELLDLGRALVNASLDPALLEIERQRKPADAAADDGYLHARRMDEIGKCLSTCAGKVEFRGGFPMDKAIYDRGMAMRRKVLGDDYVDRSIANIDDFNRQFQEHLTEYAWGAVWATIRSSPATAASSISA